MNRLRFAYAVVVLGLAAAPAAADSFGGVAGNEKSYLVGRERVCQPLAVTGGKARGVPACRAAATEEIAALSVKSPLPERGGAAELRASAKSRVLTLTRKDGTTAVTWEASDPIASVVDVWRSSYGRIAVVEYSVRRAGREVHEVVGFDLGVGGKPADTAVKPPDPTVAPPDPAVAPADPALVKAADKARKAKGKAALAAWAKVLELDGDHAEAHFRVAAVHAGGKTPAAALEALKLLAASKRPDAAEWLVEARFDKSFLKLVSDPAFRSTVGLDRPAASAYERLMGLGGQWEQSVIPCDRPEIKLAVRRDRTFRLELRSVCSGMRERLSWTGRWSQRDDAVELQLKKPGGGFDSAPCLMSRDGDEDVLTCHLDADLAFEARPVRR